MQNECRFSLEPTDVVGGAMARNEGEPATAIAIKLVRVIPLGECFRVPIQRQVVQDRPVLGEGHVVRESRTRQRHIDVGGQFAIAAHHPVVHERSVGRVVEKQHLAGVFIDLGVGRHTFSWETARPIALAEISEGDRVETVQLTTLIEAGEGHASVHDNIGAGVVLHHCSSAPTLLGNGVRRVFGDARPEAHLGLLLGEEGIGANEPVGIPGFAAAERDGVEHRVAVERVVPLDGLEQRVLRVTEIHALDVIGNRTFDHVEIPSVILPILGLPHTGAIRVGVIGREPRFERLPQLNLHVHASLVAPHRQPL
jgi:hypothetical protein